MTAFDPYALLGVARLATPAAIKSAYRRRVQSSHPDRGGDPAEFIVIVKAFALLADPESRRLFDEAGIVDEDGVRNHRRDVTAILADMFDAAVQSAVASGLTLSRVDFIGQMTIAVRKSETEAQQQASRIDGEIAALTALRTRIRRRGDHKRGEENLFVQRLDAQIEAKSTQQIAARRRALLLETAGVELGNYESDVELITALEIVP